MLLNCGVGEDSWESFGDREAWHAAVYWVTKSWTRLRSWTKLNWWAITRALHGCLRGRPSSPPWKTVSSLQFLRVWQSRILRPSALHTCIPSPRTFFNPYSLYLRPWALVIVQCSVLSNSYPMDCSTPGFPVLHHLPELAQTHVHWVGDVIQPSPPLLSPTPPALNLFQHQDIFQWVSSSHQVAKIFMSTEHK